MRLALRVTLLHALLAFLVLPGAVRAQGVGSATAKAQPLFDEATAELDAGNYASACPKLEQVTRMVPEGIGAKETLAECYEKQGKLASAWRQYLAAEAAALRQSRPERARAAAANAAALKPRCSTLAVDVPGVPPGLTLRLDGMALDARQWTEAVPVDAGAHTITASAPGYKPFSKSVTVGGNRDRVLVKVPALEAAPAAPPSTAEAPEGTAAVGPGGGARPTSWRLIGGVALTGVGVSGIALGITAGLQVADAQSALDEVRDTVPVGEDACAPAREASLPPVARDACSKAVFVPLQFLFYGLGALSGGAGAYLLATALGGSRSAGVRWIVPAAGPGHASLALAGTW